MKLNKVWFFWLHVVTSPTASGWTANWQMRCSQDIWLLNFLFKWVKFVCGSGSLHVKWNIFPIFLGRVRICCNSLVHLFEKPIDSTSKVTHCREFISQDPSFAQKYFKYIFMKNHQWHGYCLTNSLISNKNNNNLSISCCDDFSKIALSSWQQGGEGAAGILQMKNILKSILENINENIAGK